MSARPHPDTVAARRLALRQTPGSLREMFDAAQADRDAFGSGYGEQAFEQLAAIAIARLLLDESGRSVPVAEMVIGEQLAQRRRRALRAVPDRGSRDERTVRSTLYPSPRSIDVLPGGGVA